MPKRPPSEYPRGGAGGEKSLWRRFVDWFVLLGPEQPSISEGYIRKGGINRGPYQVKVRPASPAPMRPTAYPMTTAGEGVIGQAPPPPPKR